MENEIKRLEKELNQAIKKADLARDDAIRALDRASLAQAAASV